MPSKENTSRGIDLVLANLKKQTTEMSSFEFSIGQDGLFMNQPGVRHQNGAVAILSAIDDYVNGDISASEALTRIHPTDLLGYLCPRVANVGGYKMIGQGCPASAGAAIGRVVFSVRAVRKLAAASGPAVLVCKELSREDIPAFDAAVSAQAIVGVLATWGGMTSHAAIFCRLDQVPCVSGTGWEWTGKDRLRVGDRTELHIGDQVTIDGTLGQVFREAVPIVTPSMANDRRLSLLLALLDTLAGSNSIPPWYMGSAWHLRDMLVHSDPSVTPSNSLRVGPERRGKGSVRPRNRLSTSDRRGLLQFLRDWPVSAPKEDACWLWIGLRRCLFRMFAKAVGGRKSISFHRALVSPEAALFSPSEARVQKRSNHEQIQCIAEEFFAINHWIPELLEFESVRMYAAVRCQTPKDFWIAKEVAQSGDSFLPGCLDLVAFKIVVNDVEVSDAELPYLYSYLRRKEYFWRWHERSGITRKDLILALRRASRALPPNSIRSALIDAGMLDHDGRITKVGDSLLHPSDASTRSEHAAIELGS